MYGSGHDGKSLESKFGKQRATIGNQGEDYFSKALANAGLSDYTTYRSLGIPAKSNQTKLGGDVDFVIANGNIVRLIDVKRWAGSPLWTLPFVGRPMNGLAPLLIQEVKGGPRVWKRPSRNMAAALDRYRQKLPGVDVEAMVVCVPTKDSDRDSGPSNVDFLFWPGGIRSFTVGQATTELKRVLGPDVITPSPGITHLLDALQIRK
jgi:hypothetical protein